MHGLDATRARKHERRANNNRGELIDDVIKPNSRKNTYHIPTDVRFTMSSNEEPVAPSDRDAPVPQAFRCVSSLTMSRSYHSSHIMMHCIHMIEPDGARTGHVFRPTLRFDWEVSVGESTATITAAALEDCQWTLRPPQATVTTVTVTLPLGIRHLQLAPAATATTLALAATLRRLVEPRTDFVSASALQHAHGKDFKLKAAHT